VIELRLATPISNEKVDAAAAKIGKSFAQSLPNIEVKVHVDLETNRVDFDKVPDGVRLVSSDSTNILFIRALGLAHSTLPPYIGWEQHIGNARKNWESFTSVVGRRELGRIGVRYLNRIDVPAPAGEPISIEQYLNVHTDLPSADTVLNNFTKNLQMTIGDGMQMVVNIGSAPPALVDHYSFLVDIDIGCDKNLPSDEEGIWSLLESIRPLKNRYFEHYITDKARDLFK
jgi:uncharacterized protein (TIGR04255 family)